MQLFAGELTNQNQEYYKVNDNISYTTHQPLKRNLCSYQIEAWIFAVMDYFLT